jgi:hypothetical protein
MEIKKTYYLLSLENVPFSMIPYLANIHFKTILCSEYKHPDNPETGLITVYDAFDIEVKKIDIKKLITLFGPVYSFTLSKRGEFKCLKVANEIVNIEREELPHLQFSVNKESESTGQWYVTKEGKYYGNAGIETAFEKVRHLESTTYYGDSFLILRTVIELLKRKIKNDKILLDFEEFKKIGNLIIRSDPRLANLSDLQLSSVTDIAIKRMLITPLYEDTPVKYHGRVMD